MSDGEEGGEKRRRRRTPSGRAEPGRGAGLAKNVKTSRGRKLSSTLWLQRQLNDPYVERAQAAGYRSRAAFKLAELDDRFHLLKKGARVVDLGAAPGGWCQVAVERGAAKVVGVDLLEIEPIGGVTLLVGDFTEPATVAAVTAALGGQADRGRADLVLSDMAANATGHRATDHVRVVVLAEAAVAFAEDILAPGGAFVAKVFQGGAEAELLARLKARFDKVRHAKPPASRPESPETYLVATGFRAEPPSP